MRSIAANALSVKEDIQVVIVLHYRSVKLLIFGMMVGCQKKGGTPCLNF
jgi:hypothetical protein